MPSQTYKIMILLIAYCVFNFSLSSQAQWIKQSNGLPEDWGFGYAMDACDSNTAVISVRCNYPQPKKLFLTNNSGNNWNELIWPYSDRFDEVLDVSIIDKSCIWIATAHGKIYATTDAGLNWSLQFCDSTKTQYLNYIEMFDINNGVAMGDAIIFGGLNSVYFINENIGWAAGKVFFGAGLERPSCDIFKTTDGGRNWIPLSTQNMNRLNSVHFINPDTGWAVGEKSTILCSYDGGENWLVKSIPTSENLKSVQFINSKIGWIIGSKIWKTADGGDSWKDQTGQLSHAFYSCHFVEDKIGWIVGINTSKALIIKTIDGGENWTYQDAATNGLLSVHFTNQNNGWAVGLYGTIVRTKDGGINWSIQNSGTKAYLNSVYFIDDTTGWVCGDEGTVLKTTDGGEYWRHQKSDFSLGFKSIYFINPTTGWVVGNNGIIFITTDGGLDWTHQFGEKPKPALILTTDNGGLNWISVNDSCLLSAASSFWWRRIDFVNKDIGYFYASFDYSDYRINPHKIFKTMDRGRTWSSIDYPDCANALKFYNSNLGIVSASKYFPSRETIYKTSDGGNTWENYGEILGWIMDIEFIPDDSSKVWITTTGNKLYFSNDTGKTWTCQNIEKRGMDIVFADSHNGWLLCDDGIIYHTTSGGLTGINNQLQDQPMKYALLYNYPNPFNPNTTIRFSLDKAARVSLKIYNLLGQEILELLDKELASGVHSIQWDGKNAAGQYVGSGLYFACLQNNKQTKWIKLLLVK